MIGYLHYPGVQNDFSNRTQKALSVKEEITELLYTAVKNLSLSGVTDKLQRQITEWVKVSAKM